MQHHPGPRAPPQLGKASSSVLSYLCAAGRGGGMVARPGGFQQPPQPVSLASPVASDSLPVWGFLSVQPVPSDCPGQAHQEVDSQRSLGLGTGTPPGRDSRNASCVLRGRPCRVAWACSQGLEGVGSVEPGVTCSRIRNLMPTVGYVMVKLKVTMPHTHHPNYPSSFPCGGPVIYTCSVFRGKYMLWFLASPGLRAP